MFISPPGIAAANYLNCQFTFLDNKQEACAYYAKTRKCFGRARDRKTTVKRTETLGRHY